MAQLNRFAGTRPLSPAGEWTSSVYRNPEQWARPFDELEAVVLTGGGAASYDRVNSPSSTPSAASLCLLISNA